MPDFSHILMVSDLDATLLGPGSVLSPRNVEAIEFFKAQGGRFTAATGRIPPHIRKAIPQCETLFNAPAITANGAYLYDLAADRCIYSVPMDAARAKEVALLVQSVSDRIGMRVSTPRGSLVNQNRLVPAILRDIGVIPESTSVPGQSAYLAADGTPVTGLADPASITVPASAHCFLQPLEAWDPTAEPWYKLVLRGEAEDLRAIRPVIEATFGDAFEYNTSSPRFLELQKRGCTKASALRRLADICAAEDGAPIRTIAVGDQENDISMLQEADVAACPANATDEVKALSQYRLCHCAEGCIADLVERLAAE